MDKKEKPYYTGTEIVISIFQILVQFTLYHSAACLIAGIGIEESGWMYLRMGILFLPLLIYLFTRMYIRNLSIFVLIHIGCAAGLLFFFPRTVGEAAAICICLLIMLVNSVRFRIIESYYDRECPSLFLLLFLFVVYVFAAYIEKPILMKQCFYELMVFLLCYMISKNLENTENFISLNRETANFPIRQIKGVNRVLLSFFAVVMLGGMLLIPQLHLERAVEQMGEWGLIFLRWLFSLIRTKEVSPEPWEWNNNSNSGSYELPITEEMPSRLAMFLQYLMEIGTIIFLIVVVLFGIGFGLYQIYKRFYAVPLKGEERKRETDVITITESVPIFRKKKEPEEEIGGYSKKIRRQYKKSVKRRKGKTQILPSSLTPTEIENVLEYPFTDIQEKERVIVLYEKARYGKEECTKEEFEEIRKMV